MADYGIIGKRVSRPDSISKVTGRAKYTADLSFPGMLVGKILRSRKHHARIVCLHLKDRKKDQGRSMPFGQGDTPIKECLQLLKRNRWKIPANIEYDVRGGDPVAEFKKAYEFCRQALA